MAAPSTSTTAEKAVNAHVNVDVPAPRQAPPPAREPELPWELQAVQAADLALFETDLSGRLLRVSGRWQALTGASVADSTGASLTAFLHTQDEEPWQAALRQVTDGTRSEAHVELLLADGRSALLSVRPASHGSTATGVFGALRLVDEQGPDARHSADAITGLPGRAELLVALAEVSSPHTLLVVRARELNRIGLTLGAGVADGVARSISSRLLRLGAISAARLADDVFALLLPGGDQLAWVGRVQTQLRAPHGVAGRELRVAVHLGAALAPSCDEENPDECPLRDEGGSCPDSGLRPGNSRAEDLLRRAQAALVVAAERGSDYAIWTRDVERDVERRLAFDAEMRGALTAGQFTVHYQPIWRAELDEDGRVQWQPVGAEALVRWAHPVMGLLLPGSFIDVAAETGLLEEIDGWVLRTATWDAAASFPPTARVSVNVSSLQLSRPDFPQDVADALAVSALEPGRLVVEVVESDLRGDQTCVDNVQALRRMGVHVAIDDFGVGHSHLARLTTLEVDILKVDRSFVGEGRRLLSTAVKIGHDLGLEVVVEGAERSDDLARFAQQGVLVQSFAFARPMPLEAVRSLLVGS